ncbi:hypothetical protein EVAR_43017_1 [Eumeta japonica]|uniref:Uncharacterized protein n=1 Tax=Eumeta variegata TaxID=151549 RepID=A0A4C1XJQ0_EUMVA|nr:hypothetical protein EVAR_43017_1 [Eumeta japonica]
MGWLGRRQERTGDATNKRPASPARHVAPPRKIVGARPALHRTMRERTRTHIQNMRSSIHVLYTSRTSGRSRLRSRERTNLYFRSGSGST